MFISKEPITFIKEMDYQMITEDFASVKKIGSATYATPYPRSNYRVFKATIYNLEDSFGKIFYIGFTTNCEARLKRHIGEAFSKVRRGIADKKDKVIVAAMGQIKIVPITEVTLTNRSHFHLTYFYKEENYWIELFRAWGFDLCNARRN